MVRVKQVVGPVLCASILYARLQIPSVEYRKPYFEIPIFCEVRNMGIFDINTNYRQVFDERTWEALPKA